MVRQRKSHTRLKKGCPALAEVSREMTGTEGHPEEGKCYDCILLVILDACNRFWSSS